MVADVTHPEPTAGAGPAALATEAVSTSQPRGDIWRRFRRNRLALVGSSIVVLLVLAALLAPLITFHDPGSLSSNSRQPPSRAHWFGTDRLGRDLYTRVVYGARVSLVVGTVSVAIAGTIGVVAGSLAGYYGRFIDTLLMRVTDVFLAFPYILAAIAIITSGIVGQGVLAVILVLGLLGWMTFARIIRSSILQVKETEYIEAARAIGCSDARIIVRHILPNSIQPVIVFATIFVGTAVLAEAALSFLGLGITEPTPAWGLMVSQAKGLLFSSPHLLFFPGAAIFVTVMAFVFVGDGLRDALDPRLR